MGLLLAVGFAVDLRLRVGSWCLVDMLVALLVGLLLGLIVLGFTF